MVEVLLSGVEGCVEHMCQGMRLGVDILLQMWKERSCCLRFEKLDRDTYGCK